MAKFTLVGCLIHKERNPRAKTPVPRADESVSTLVALPTSEEIAELLRHRPVHIVLIDFCSDLDVVTADPMWIELRCALVENGGRVVTFYKDLRKRIRITNFFPPDIRNCCEDRYHARHRPPRCQPDYPEQAAQTIEA